MSNRLIKLAVIVAFGICTNSYATGLVPLPSTGFAVSAGSNQVAGTTGWVECNTTGNYGSDNFVTPNLSFNNDCAVFPGGGRNVTTSPVSTIATALNPKTVVNITANGEILAILGQRAWRNAANTQCIFAKYIDFATNGTFDYNPALSGMQSFAANDIAVGGYSATATVSAGYYFTAAGSNSPIFRMGRAFTSVQMQANPSNSLVPAAGFVRRPVNSPAPASGTEINGIGQTASPGTIVPTPAQQTSEIRTNWVDFTLDSTGGLDEDGTTSQNSPVLYVQSDCNGTITNSLASSVRIRQTGQETQPWVTILTGGQAPNGANANF